MGMGYPLMEKHRWRRRACAWGTAATASESGLASQVPSLFFGESAKTSRPLSLPSPLHLRRHRGGREPILPQGQA